MSSNKSEVEQLYEQLQQKVNGNIPWYNLPRQTQDAFIQSVNWILQICSQRN